MLLLPEYRCEEVLFSHWAIIECECAGLTDKTSCMSRSVGILLNMNGDRIDPQGASCFPDVRWAESRSEPLINAELFENAHSHAASLWINNHYSQNWSEEKTDRMDFGVWQLLCRTTSFCNGGHAWQRHCVSLFSGKALLISCKLTCPLAISGLRFVAVSIK